MKKLLLLLAAFLILPSSLFASDERDLDPKDTISPYLIEESQVSCNDEVILDVDLNTFEYVGYGYAKDKNYVYFCQKIEGSDPETFEYVGWGYFKDKSQVYHSFIEGEYQLTEYGDYKIDRESKKLIIDDSEFAYPYVLIDKTSIPLDYVVFDKPKSSFDYFYVGGLMRGVDPASFEIISYHLSRDENAVYIQGGKLNEIDAGSFSELDTIYWKDVNRVYYGLDPIEGSDIESFEALDEEGLYSLDKNHAYMMGKPIFKSDAATFEYIEGQYAKDKNHVYLRGTIINNASPDTFESIGRFLSKDSQSYYCDFDALKIFDVDSTEILIYDPEFYIKTKDAIWWAEYCGDLKKIEGVDLYTFEFSEEFEFRESGSAKYPDNYYAKDKNHVYLKGEKIDVTPQGYTTNEVKAALGLKDKKEEVYVPIQKVAVPTNFIDVEWNSLYKNAIDHVVGRGIFKGYEDNEFRPENNINRAEFSKIMILSQYAQSEVDNCDVSTVNFSDVENSHWAAPYICLAKEKGIINGYPDGTFRMSKSINLAEALKIVLNTYGVRLPELKEGAEWYTPYFEKANQNSLLELIGLDPSKKMTRGDSAILINEVDLNLYPTDFLSSHICLIEPGYLPYSSDGFEVGISKALMDEVEVDVDTFQSLKGCEYFKDKDRVYYYHNGLSGRELRVVEETDPEAFSVIYSSYGKDNKKVYHMGEPVDRVKSRSVILISNYILADEDSVYAIDFSGDKTWFKIKEADPSSFVANFNGFDYQKDKNNVYYKGEKINLNPETLVYINYRYAYDDKKAYYENKLIGEIDPDSFVVYGDGLYSKDKNNVYYMEKKIVGADAESFEAFDCCNAKDKFNKYSGNQIDYH